MDAEQLIRESRQGNPEAFEDLVRLFYPYVSGFLLKMTADRSLAEDLTQETFLKMIQNFDCFDSHRGTSFGTWLISISKNCYIDSLRKNRMESADVEQLEVADPRDVAADVIRRTQYEEVQQAVHKLPVEQAAAIHLKYEEELSLKEIAQRFGVEPKTIKSRIHEGTVRLRKMLQAGWKE